MFNFYDIAPGSYDIHYIINGNHLIYNYTFIVKEREIYHNLKLLNAYSNIQSYEYNQIIYFLFYGINYDHSLKYIVLNDKYSRKFVLDLYACKKLNKFYPSPAQFEYSCRFGLNHTIPGVYTISEYHINHTHYYTNNTINIYVQ